MQFETRPEVQEWGNDKVNIPLNVKEVPGFDAEGNPETHYQADVLCKVKKPVSQDSIVEAAVEEKYDEAARQRIMRNWSKENDAEVEEYKAFVAEIRESAKAEGYE